MDSPLRASRPGFAVAGLRSRALPRLLWVALFTLSMLVGLGGRALTEPDEGRGGEIAREILATGDYIVPHFDSLPHPDKPIGYFLLVAGSFRLLGISAASARLPSVLATLLTVLLTGAFARRIFGPGTGLIAAGALLVSPLTWCYGQLAILDPTFTLATVGAVMAFYLAVEAASTASRSEQLAWSLIGWASTALAILIKGPVGLLLPLITALPYSAWRRQARAVLDWRGALLAGALVTPWLWMLCARVPGLIHYVAVVEIWDRLIGAGQLQNRSKPIWYFVPMLLVGAFPWSAVALSAAARALRSRAGPVDRRWVLIALWIIPPLVLFSLSRSKLPHYVLPLMPAFALVVAGLWVRPAGPELPGLRGACWTWIALGLACAIAPFLPAVRQLPEPFHWQALTLALAAGTAAMAAGVSGLLERIEGASTAVWVVSSPVLIIYMAAQPFLGSLADALSSRDVAQAIRAAVPAGGEVIGVHALPTALPFYLRQRVHVASANGAEVTSNYVVFTYRERLGPSSALLPSGAWREALQACQPATVFVINSWEDPVREALTAAGLPLIARNASYEAYGPCPARGR